MALSHSLYVSRSICWTIVHHILYTPTTISVRYPTVPLLCTKRVQNFEMRKTTRCAKPRDAQNHESMSVSPFSTLNGPDGKESLLAYQYHTTGTIVDVVAYPLTPPQIFYFSLQIYKTMQLLMIHIKIRFWWCALARDLFDQCSGYIKNNNQCWHAVFFFRMSFSHVVFFRCPIFMYNVVVVARRIFFACRFVVFFSLFCYRSFST